MLLFCVRQPGMFKEELQVDPLLFIALLAGIAVVIGVILWTRLDAFPALLLGAVTTGLIAGVAPSTWWA